LTFDKKAAIIKYGEVPRFSGRNVLTKFGRSDIFISMIGIYGLQNKLKPEKWYIGQSRNIKKRWSKYQQMDCKNQPKLYNALQKYGYDGFTRVVLEECAADENTLKEREAYWATHYNSVEMGYNVDVPGPVRIMSVETRKKLSEAHRGRKLSPEHCAAISAGKMGHITSSETRAKLRETSRNCVRTAEWSANISAGLKRWRENKKDV
jgi:group I intron endonuclease